MTFMLSIFLCTKKWLKANNDGDEREYVGVGFMNLKEMVEEQGTLFNTKVKIQDLGGNVTAPH